MSVEKVRQYLKQWNLQDKVQELAVSSATVELAAAAIGCAPQRIAKTLSFKVDGQPVLIVCAGDAKVDNAKYKEQFAAKAKMLTPEEAVELVGHSVGGVCPFAVNAGVAVYLDVSLKRFDSVFPACGSSSSVIELSIQQMEQCSHYAAWVDVCKAWAGLRVAPAGEPPRS